ncbi:MAG: type II toxin-antitoxin system VapC family toxin [Verrucomicrobiae bacterium]|nr:type II toxin-antitoxin system VapC family toxin [Verrucomicrobiae bacterium]
MSRSTVRRPAWFFEEEATAATDALTDRLNQGAQGVVARHWPLEVANTLLMGERRRRCLAADIAHFPGSAAVTSTLALAREHRLTAHDAACLELAMRRRISLATLDLELRKAAKAVGVECLPELPQP